MKQPKYRFLCLEREHPMLAYWGHYDRTTGQFVSDAIGSSTVACSQSFLAAGASQRYISADGSFTKSNSYVVIKDSNHSVIDVVQLASIIGKRYSVPPICTLCITLDYTETSNYPAIGQPYVSPLYVGYECSPKYSKLSKKIGRESNQMFFRETLDTDLHFTGQEADFILGGGLWGLGVDSRFMIICERWHDGVPAEWQNYHTDLFNYTDCDFKRDTHTCTPKLTPLDEYTRILAKYSDSYDLIKLKPAISRIMTSLRPIIELYELGSGVITRFLGGTYWETEIVAPVDNETTLNNKYFARIVVDDDLAYMDVTVLEQYSSWFVGGRYQYDPSGHSYFLKSGQDVWEWHPSTVMGNPALALTLNGNPVMIQPQNAPVIIMPNGYTGQGDLPLDQTTPDVINIFYIDPGTALPVFIPVGAAFARKYAIFGRVVGNTNTLMGLQAYDLPLDDFAVDSPIYKKCAPLSDKAAGFFYGSLDTSFTPTIYGIKENPDEYYTNENLPIEGGISGVKPMPIGKYEWGTISYWYNYAADYVALEEQSRYDYYLRDCFTIGSAIKALLSEIDSSIEFDEDSGHSEFLYSLVDMKAGYDWRLAITPKSNVLKGDYDQPARKAPITFEELMNMLRDLYHLYWYIDEKRQLHIEHAVWFNNGGSYTSYAGSVQLDLTSSACKDAFNKKRTIYWQDSFKFEMGEAARRYELGFAEKGTEFFDGLAIDLYDPYLNTAKVDTRSIANYTGDIDLMRIEPNKYSSDGFAVLAYLETVPANPNDMPDKYVPVIGAVEVRERDGWVRDAYINNLFTSWLYCQHFLMFDISGEQMKQDLKLNALPNNERPDAIQGYAYLKKQSVQFPFDDDPDTIDLIITDVGNGAPESFDVEALTRTVKATLAFPIKTIPVT